MAFNSNLTQDRRRDGQVISYSYDALNRPGNTANGGTLAYDNFGRITSASLAGTTDSFTYDALSRKLSETQPLGTVSSGYDADGHRTSLTYPDGYAVSYTYDATGALSTVSDSTAGLIASYTYDNLGRLTALARNGGPSTGASYSTADLTLYSLSHSFSDTTKNVTFGYLHSPAGQLTTSTSSNTLYNYTVPASVATSYGVDGQNKLTSVGGVGVSSDARGNLTSDGTTGVSYGYDVANELISTSAGATLSYDALGRLLTTVNAAKATTRFLYDGSQILEEFVSSGEDERFVLGAGVDQPLVWFQGVNKATTKANRLWLLPNHQGSIIAVANATTTTAINTFDEAGNQGASNTGRFQFDGMPYIGITGLYIDRARDYDPTLGRFMQSDPMGYGDGMNWYNYVHGDPVNGWDPSGLDGDIDTGPEDFGDPIEDVTEVVVTASRCPKAYSCYPFFSFSFGNPGIVVGGGQLDGGGGGSQTAASPQNNQPPITCASRLPNGKTVGDMVQELNQQIAAAEDEGNVLSGAMTFFQGVNTGGLLDFKNTMRGQGYSGSYLAAAGNFAYGAAGADYFGGNLVGAQLTYFGGTVYAGTHFKANSIPPGTIFPQDASGAANIGAGIKSGGC